MAQVKDSMSNGHNPALEVSIPSDPTEARKVQEAVETALKAHKYSEHDIFSIRLALEEALINAIKHGNRMDRSKTVRIAYHVCAEQFDISIVDEGPGFDPGDVPDPTAIENLERPCGRGLMLMRFYMNEVSFGNCGNSVFMRKVRNNGSPSGRG